jgi:DNA repair photolyase
LAEFRNPVTLITKNHLITRDIDHLMELARFNAVAAAISVTTLDVELTKILEPRASPPSRRLAAIQELSAAGIPVLAMMAPVIPGLTDHEMPAVFAAAAAAGALDCSITPLRLPGAVAPIFEAWLDQYAPGKKDKVLGRVREMRGGKLNDPRFNSRMEGEGFYAEQMQTLFTVARKKAGFPKGLPKNLSTAFFRVPSAQLTLGL